MMIKNKPLTKRDQRYIKSKINKAIAYIPYGVQPLKNLDLIGEVIKAVDGLKDTEITSCKEYKRIFRYAYILGCYSIMQHHNEYEFKRKISKEEYSKIVNITQKQKEELNKPLEPDYSRGI